MVTHIVIFTWTTGTTPAHVAALGAALDRLAVEVAPLATISHGPDAGFRDGNGDYALIARLADRAAWDAYQAHPQHRAFVQDFVVPIQAARVAVQF